LREVLTGKVDWKDLKKAVAKAEPAEAESKKD
jgi:hypothetical protein